MSINGGASKKQPYKCPLDQKKLIIFCTRLAFFNGDDGTKPCHDS